MLSTQTYIIFVHKLYLSILDKFKEKREKNHESGYTKKILEILKKKNIE